MSEHILSLVVFLPALVAVLLTVIPRKYDGAFYVLGVLATAFTLGVSIQLYTDFMPGKAGYQFEEILAWIPSYGITYYVGIDGISLVLILLTTVLTMVAMFASFESVAQRRKDFVISILILETAMIGTFAALDVFLFYVFWEAVLIPMYFLIGVYGGPRRIYATVKFFIYTMAGSVLMLVALLVVYAIHIRQFGFASTAIHDLYRVQLEVGVQNWLFGAFLIAFAIKIPIFPFHTWLPDAHVEAPTAGSILLAGVLLKMGGYGILRYAFPLFPQAATVFAPYLGILGVIGIIYGACVALAQEDIKRLIAYSSVSHMGFVVLGMASLTPGGMGGAVFQMVAHGIATGTLFLLVGIVYERRHTRMMTDFGGLALVMPRMATAFLLMTLASIGLPGLSGFVGEFLILAGSFHALVLIHPAWLTGIAILGIVLGAGYMLYLFERVFFGNVRFAENQTLPDLTWRETGALALPTLLVIWLGIQPNIILSPIGPSVEELAARTARHQIVVTQEMQESRR